MSRGRSFMFGLGAVVASSVVLGGSPARAAVPAGYTGTPHGGTPKAIPGRVNLVDYDDGGDKVGFDVEHNGDVGCAGYDYRMDKPTPVLCKTSAQEGDKFSAGPMMGMTFPSATGADYYVGAVRPNDWVQVTVDVKQAGMYVVSTDWASDAGMINVKISFNGVQKIAFMRAGTGGYHNWVPGPMFATVQLDAGVQVMRFQSVVEHINMDYLSFALMGDPTGAAGTAGGAAGTAGGAAGTGGGAGTAGGAAGTAGGAAGTAGGAAGTTAATGAAGTTATGAAGTTATGAAGTTATTGAAGTTTTGAAGTGAAGTGAPRNRDDDGGCACALGGDGLERRGAAALFLVASGLLAAARRRRRR